jgi:4-amino-4-deoxy-L-arabinose transferase-like glycosyltransferase
VANDQTRSACASILTRIQKWSYDPRVSAVTSGSREFPGNGTQPTGNSWPGNALKYGIVSVLLIALGLRVGAALIVQDHLDDIPDRDFVIEGDAEGYWLLAKQLADGGDYEIYTPARRVMRMPGFSLLLALSVKLAGPNLLYVRIGLAIVGTLACCVLYWLGCELFDRRVGTLAAALAAVSPALVGFSVVVLTETLFAVCLTGSLVVLAKIARTRWRSSTETDENNSASKPQLKKAIAAGVLVAVACYVRPTWVLVAPGFALIHCIRLRFERPAIVESVAIMIALVISLTPWTIRNYQVTGHVIPTTLWVGPSLYDGLSENATGISDMRFFDNENLMASMSEYEMDKEYQRRAWKFARENPGRAVSLGFIKFWRFWKPWPNAAQFQAWWMRIGLATFVVPMFGFALVGVWQHKRDLAVVVLTAGPIVYFSVIHSLFIGSLRYRLPAEYPFLILTSVGILVAWDKWSPKTKPEA